MNLPKYCLAAFICLGTLWTSCSTGKPKAIAPAKPSIILKLDDLWFEDGLVHPGWTQVFDFLNQENITGTIGVVCNSLEEGNEEYFSWIQEREAEDHEIWHHGYCHCKPTVEGEEKREFRGTDFDYQLEHLSEAQQLAKDKIGIVFRTFGAPYNSTDSNTARALDNLPDIKIWLYKETTFPTNKYVMDRVKDVNIEYPVHIPDYEKFQKGYELHKTKDLLVIQGHPRSWVEDATRFEDFKRIVLFLQAEGVTFTTPYAYYNRQQVNNR